ncbi:MAG: tetratricopeptide repeat protein [Flavobacterium sp.]|jgi:tetratricopeptide (TPR) repeat protein|uniref:Tetratricopeptide repeat protein n=1 Tax=Flavobacterium algoritolerans TaxID=3041254 RepID=A0ABT6V9G4_9FLAO|nr:MULTISPECIES: tetratricopeptide repeat protein [Flavobacterium]MDI5894849.1 tetratricopeptide repeat protein [Flavobacterium algoritolerans]MDP3680333.1 tetratricopeptide repeat protein [Flavobacterium sp.]MDZ4332001.1 tetratricopeptide repeat protein [Flavobacterium sp.]PIF63167.1 tetratricopeptide repeat protein [Flavobacterium sp. 11]RKS13969.1 tetratricopeptide repeat protein [Flavobacterium sp. 120]
MKSKYVLLASALLISVATFAQKDQIKAAEKALKAGKSQEAVTILNEAEYLVVNAPDAEKAQFFFVKGNSLLDLANKNVDTNTNLSLAAKAYQDLIAAEKTSGKVKFSTQAAASITDIKFKLINGAIADSKVDKHADSAKKLYDAYLLDKKDTINLYYAASTYVNAKDYDAALKLYDDLKNLNYSGKGTSYFAVNKLTSQEDFFTTLQERDRMVKLGTHEKPRTEVIPSKRGEIYKNMALILVEKGKTEEAKKAISEARIANPEDTSLTLTEANLYLETKDFDMYKKLIAEVLEKNPNDADLIFNLGVLSANAKNVADAEKYYKRVIEINPKYINGYINLAALKLENEKAIIDEMNKLGTSTKDMKRYDELKKKREELFKGTIPYLEKAVELDPKNTDVSKTLLGVYSALEMTAEYKALKAKM